MDQVEIKPYCNTLIVKIWGCWYFYLKYIKIFLATNSGLHGHEAGRTWPSQMSTRRIFWHESKYITIFSVLKTRKLHLQGQKSKNRSGTSDPIKLHGGAPLNLQFFLKSVAVCHATRHVICRAWLFAMPCATHFLLPIFFCLPRGNRT